MTTLQDIMGLITKRKIKTPSDNDYIISAAYTDIYERLKPQPKMEPNLLSLGAIKAYIGSGSQGPPGAAATIAIGTTTTGAAGSSAVVTNVGTSSAAIFNFTIPQGAQGVQGIPGSAAASCPDHFTLAAVSGLFQIRMANSPNLTNMYSGNNTLGWSYGYYDLSTNADGFGNLLFLKDNNVLNTAISLPIDLNVGDTVKISGIVYIPTIETGVLPEPLNTNFYVTVSHFNCSDLNDGAPPLYTVIPVATYPINDIDNKSKSVCFTESITLGTILPSNETFFVVGLHVGCGEALEIYPNAKFSYTLSATQVCIAAGTNLLIRNCCDPAFSEVIINNEVAVGSSFVDNEGNCWTVEAETLNSVTGIRTKVSEYSGCSVCIAANLCPENLIVQSCCEAGAQFFSGALAGLDVGDTFVDTNGYCWSIIDTTGAPITNNVTVGTAYPATDCDSSVCTDANTCPTPVRLFSCCDLGYGSTSLEILQAAVPTLAVDDYFVDTFGFCWQIAEGSPAFPNLSFITPATEELRCGEDLGCTELNTCPVELKYTVQNCCTEEIEVLILNSTYNINSILTLELATGYGCYKILSWSDTGIVTATVVSVDGVYSDCIECTTNLPNFYCASQSQCCWEYENDNQLSVATITGYRCDGSWIVDFVLPFNATICMAQVIRSTFGIDVKGCCTFDVLNPSESVSISVGVSTCNLELGEITIPPGVLLSTVLGNLGYEDTCARCVEKLEDDDNDFLYVECNPL
jgi:hypothetical protein